VAELRREPRGKGVLDVEVEAEPRHVSVGRDRLELVGGRTIRRPPGPEVVADPIVLERVGIYRAWRLLYAVQHLLPPPDDWK